jgi:hypothetical protein
MNDQETGAPGDSRQLAEAQQLLYVLEMLLDSETTGSQKHQLLLEYCEKHVLEESWIWSELALYRLQGLAGDPAYEPERYVGFFDYRRHKVRTRIVELIGKLPTATLPDFTALLDFQRHFLQRLTYVTDLLVYFFLEREKGLERQSQETRVYTTFLDHKLFGEFYVINEILSFSDDLEGLNTHYRDWSSERAFDEEVPL